MQLRYCRADELALEREDLPERWPLPADPRFPFSADLVDFVRPVGPGVFVGLGWTRPDSREQGRKFLHFLMVRSGAEA